MKKLIKKENKSLNNKIIAAYNSLEINQINKLLKNKPNSVIIDALNTIDDDKAIIFTLISFTANKKQKLILGLDYSIQRTVLELATESQLKIILKNLYPDELSSLLDQHQEFEKKIFLSINKERRKEVNKLQSYEEDEIGRLMNPNFLSIQKNWTIKKAINHIKSQYNDVETGSIVFVTDGYKKFVGYVKIHDLFFNEKWSDKVMSITSLDIYKVKPTDDLEEVINLFEKYGLRSLPVVNSRDVLIGFINNKDISIAIQEGATEDIYNMYGITELRKPYLHSSVWNISRSRLLWLVILMITATLTSLVLDQFQSLGENLTGGLSSILLVPLLPVLTGTSGNAGSQASASIIRSLSIGEITKKEYWKAILKEIQVGILIGFILALVNFARLLIYYIATINDQIAKFAQQGISSEMGYVYSKLAIIGATTSLTLFISIFISKLLGAALPIIATRFNIDPTVMSAPILATILDVTTTTTLFGIGIGIIHLVL